MPTDAVVVRTVVVVLLAEPAARTAPACLDEALVVLAGMDEVLAGAEDEELT